MKSINAEIEFAKWLSYEPEFENERKNKLLSKSINNLSIKELKELKILTKKSHISSVFKRLLIGKCDMNEYIEALNYMQSNSIIKIMKEKLTKEEIEIGDNLIDKTSELDDNDLNILVENNKIVNNYSKLSMIEAYALHYLDTINLKRNSNKIAKRKA